MGYENCSWCSSSPVSDCHSRCKCVCHYEEAWDNHPLIDFERDENDDDEKQEPIKIKPRPKMMKGL